MYELREFLARMNREGVPDYEIRWQWGSTAWGSSAGLTGMGYRIRVSGSSMIIESPHRRLSAANQRHINDMQPYAILRFSVRRKLAGTALTIVTR